MNDDEFRRLIKRVGIWQALSWISVFLSAASVFGLIYLTFRRYQG